MWGAPYMGDEIADPAFVGASPSPERRERGNKLFDDLVRVVEMHVKSEAEALHSYERLANENDDPTSAFVMRMILDDEERHHSLLQRMRTSLVNALTWGHDSGGLPSGLPPLEPVDPERIATVKQLIEEEKEHVRQARHMAHEHQRINGGLDAVLFEMMALDSEKHAFLLQFVLDRLRQRPLAGERNS